MVKRYLFISDLSDDEVRSVFALIAKRNMFWVRQHLEQVEGTIIILFNRMFVDEDLTIDVKNLINKIDAKASRIQISQEEIRRIKRKLQ